MMNFNSKKYKFNILENYMEGTSHTSSSYSTINSNISTSNVNIGHYFKQTVSLMNKMN